MNINRELIEKFYGGLDERSQEALDAAAERVVAAKNAAARWRSSPEAARTCMRA